jgi:molybdopterin-synthase adenylyltransferase
MTVPATLSWTEEQARAAATGESLRAVELAALDRGQVPARYLRSLGAFTIGGQRRLLTRQVLVVGLGGLGGYVVELLARAGVGVIHGCDPDFISEDNLNRQLLATVDTLSQPKTEAARQRIQQVNPAVEFVPHPGRFQDQPWPEGLALVFDCLDSIPARLALEEQCAASDLTLIHGAIAGWCGQVAVARPNSGLLAGVYRGQTRGIEAEWGNPPFTPAVAAALMAARGVAVLLERAEVNRAMLRFFDLLVDDWVALRR